MTTTPVLAPPEAQPSAAEPDLFEPPAHAPSSESLSKPFRLGIVGLGAALGLFARLLAANGFGDLDSRSLMLAAAATSFVMGLGLVMIAAERDRFGPPLMWITAVTAAAWGTLNWMSPPFAESVTVWSNRDQLVLAVLGIGNGLLVAGIVALAFVRRGPTLTVAATLLAGVAALIANTLLLRKEWAAIITLGVGFFLVLLAWDRSPRREPTFVTPEEPPRVSRAALSFISVALCGTALQLWISRTDIPRSLPAVALALLLIGAAFASMIRVRREIEQRETTLSEWTSWIGEIRTKTFRSEIETFDSSAAPATYDPTPIGSDGEAPRKLSFPNLTVADADGTPTTGIPTTGTLTPDTLTPDVTAASPTPSLVPDTPSAARSDTIVPDIKLPSADSPSLGLPTADAPGSPAAMADAPRLALPTADMAGQEPTAAVPTTGLPRIDLTPAAAPAAADATTPRASAAAIPGPAATSGAFSSMLGVSDPTPTSIVQVSDLDALDTWLTSPAAAARVQPLLITIEAMTLDEFESLPPEDAAIAREEIGSYLADSLPTADLVSWIDGPYFIVALAAATNRELAGLNTEVQSALRATDGVHAFLRPGPDASLSDLVDEAVAGILRARQQHIRLGR